MSEPLLTRYLQPLLAGRRAECFQLIRDAVAEGWRAEEITKKIIWPSLAQIDQLFRDDRINIATEHLAVRINRAVADQLQPLLTRGPRIGKSIIIMCADGEPEELGAQMIADLFDAAGWEAFFLGGGVPNDETLTLLGQLRPDVLLIFGTRPEGVAGTRRLIELIRGIGTCPTMNILVSGGIYGRADGLWQEVGADVMADTAEEALRTAATLMPRRPGPMPMGMVKKRRRRRRQRETAPAPEMLAPA